VGAHPHYDQSPKDLRYDGPGRRLAPAGLGPEREVIGRLPHRLSPGHYGSPNVDDIGRDQYDRHYHLHVGRQRHDARTGGQGEEDEEEYYVPSGDPLVYDEVRTVLPAIPETQNTNPDDEHGKRSEEKRRPEDRADADLAGGFSTTLACEGRPDKCDHRYHGLRQGCSHGREHAPDRPLAQV
jgi:hypothetical protein